MRPRLATILLLLAGAALVPARASAVEVAYDLGFYSHYVWRGITLTDEPVFQPSLLLSHRSGFSVKVWGNLDLGGQSDTAGELNELDITVEYAWGPEPLELAVGLIDYNFPNTAFPGTWEAYASLRGRTVVSPSLTVYYDFDELEDVYANLAIAYDHELSDTWSVSFAVSAGYAGSDFAIGGESGLHDGNVKLAVTRTGKVVSVGLLAAYTDSLDEDVLLEQPVGAWGGVHLGLDF